MRVDTTTVPTGYTLTTANMPLSVTLTAGQNYTTADFGYKVAALSISKVSSAGGQVKAGQTITYTLNILNNTAAQQTGITVSDALPTGTTYVANSTLANGFMPYFDNFATLSIYTTNQPDPLPGAPPGLREARMMVTMLEICVWLRMRLIVLMAPIVYGLPEQLHL